MLKKSAVDALKTYSKKVVQKIAESTNDFIGNNMVDRITSGTITSEHDKEIHKILFCISPEERQEIIDQKNNKFD